MIRNALFLSLSHIKCPNAREVWRLSVCNRFDVFCFCLFFFINMSTCSIFHSPDVNFDELARCTDDYNGAMLKAVCVEAVR